LVLLVISFLVLVLGGESIFDNGDMVAVVALDEQDGDVDDDECGK